ncbi:MAG: NAD(P)H-binding protein [Thermoplasmata archaeon]|nr:NAD(P)H-binding protein [Thermoplasmata archaeon]
MLLVGGGGGLAGRALVQEFAGDWDIRSVHRTLAPEESAASVEWVPADVATVPHWGPMLDGVDVVVNVAWYRSGPDRRFRPLAEGLSRLISDCRTAGVRRFVHISVPVATDHIESTLPYMLRKRQVDAALIASGVDFSIVRPTMLFGPQDKLLTVMLRTMRRWHRFPMFGDGSYHVSPIAVRDLARIVRREAGLDGSRTLTAGGPRTWGYRELTDFMFGTLGLSPHYFQLSARAGERLARWLEILGSTLLYPYEVEWLVSDRLGFPPYEGLATPLEPVEPFLRGEGMRLRSHRPNG